MAVTTLIYEAGCPSCGQTHTVRVQTAIAQWDGPGVRELRRGDPMQLADLDARGYVVVLRPSTGDPIVILENEYRCPASPRSDDQTLWTEVTVDGGTLAEARLVRMNSEELRRLHFICGRSCVFWDWESALPDPGNWNEDELYTKDPVRRLRNKLMLRESLVVRNQHEIALFVETFGLRQAGPLTRTADGLWEMPCHGGSSADFAVPVHLRFDLEDPAPSSTPVANLPGGPSEVLPADVFRRKADELIARVPVYASDLDRAETRELLERSRHELAQAIVYLRQLRHYIAPGEDAVPETAIWGDAPRAIHAERPDRYTRSRIDATLTRWSRELESFGQQPSPVIRTAEEAHVFMALHPCPRCNTATPQLRSHVAEQGGGLASIYEGECPQCGLPRRFELELSPELPAGGVRLGDGRSRCLDPGQLLAASDLFARRGDPYSLELAVACLDEALKLVPDGAARVPEDAIPSRAGWAVYDAEPGRFDRARIEAVRDTYRKLATA
ncbi:MAG TPA: hypothetical protein VFQ53_37610 [Kofleriaceae bacterium]|nr:hypothetical protein [Kofleriaceae bacterium]